MKASFSSATTWTAEGTVVNSNAPSEKLSSSPFSQLPEVHFTLFPLFLKATYESDFYLLNIKEPFPLVLSWVKITLPGRNIQERMTEFGLEEKISIGCFSCFLSPHSNLPEFRDSFKSLRPRVWVVMRRFSQVEAKVFFAEKFPKPKYLLNIFWWLILKIVLIWKVRSPRRTGRNNYFHFSEWPLGSLNLGRTCLAIWGQIIKIISLLEIFWSPDVFIT